MFVQQLDQNGMTLKLFTHSAIRTEYTPSQLYNHFIISFMHSTCKYIQKICTKKCFVYSLTFLIHPTFIFKHPSLKQLPTPLAASC